MTEIRKIEPISVISKTKDSSKKQPNNEKKQGKNDSFGATLKAEQNKLTKDIGDFDFRKQYAKGQRLWYINFNELTDNLSIEDITVSTVYQGMLIGRIEEGEARCIDFYEKDMLYDTPLEAENAYKVMKESLYGTKNDN